MSKDEGYVTKNNCAKNYLSDTKSLSLHKNYFHTKNM